MLRITPILLVVSLLLPAFSTRGAAQDHPPVTIAWADLYPWFYRDANSTNDATGFAIELARELGRDIGFEVTPYEVDSYAEWGQAQASGQSVLLPSVAKLPVLRDTNVFSQPIFETDVRLAVAVENVGAFDLNDLTGTRIGVLTPGAGSDPELLPNAELVPYPNIRDAMMGLLSGEVNAISAEATFVFAEARKARLDHRISFVGAPLINIERVVAIHQSRAELLDPINDALTRMKQDGRLADLQERFIVELPAPVPDVLTVGVFDLPPHMILSETGSPSGFAVEVLQDLAEIASLELQFTQVTLQGLAPGETHDILPLASITPERMTAMDFAYPVESTQFSIFVRSGESRGISDLSDLHDLRLGILDVSVAKRLALAEGLEKIVYFDGRRGARVMINALLDGEIDAFLFASQNVREFIESDGLTDAVAEISPPVFLSQRAPALRLGLGAVRERLNTVIPGYLISEDYKALREKYFGSPVFWTPLRIAAAMASLGGLVLLFIVGAALSGLHARAKTAEAEARAAQSDRDVAEQGRFLETIFNAATSGIVAVDMDGQVVRANNAARHMLGGISDAPPFPWPKGIDFIDPETMQPVDGSENPLLRALSGNVLHGETHLVRRKQAGDNRRYVRVNSAWLQTQASGELAVLVIDDVTGEERNRQAIERKSRLDALGQLTGGIAHDFNNLLASQLYAVDLARKAKDAGKREKFLDVALNSIHRARSLTSRLLSFARRQPGRSTARLAVQIFEEFETLVTPMIEEKINLAFSVDDPDLRVYCDQTQLETALMNLVLNSRDAILASEKGNQINLRARAVRSPNDALNVRQRTSSETVHDDKADKTSSYRYVEILVSDNGHGMDSETLARSTDPFFTTKAKTSGTGLGLAMVYGFVNQSDGDLKIYSEEMIGTTVQMTLPRGTEQGARETPMPNEVPLAGGGETIFVVEDEMQLLVMIVEVLEDLGYGVVSAQSGVQALQMVNDGLAFDLLLTDVVMPGNIGGFELARRVRAIRPDMPVIYTSGYTGFTASEMGEVQAPLLQKPAPPTELAATISEELNKVR